MDAPEMKDKDLYDRGMAVRRSVLGDAHVDRSLERATEFDADFQEFITKTAWGQIWTRPGLDIRTRSMLTIAMLAGLHPLGVIAAGVFVAGVLVGADSMSRAVGVPTYIADVIVATSLIAVLVATLLTQYRVRWK